MIQETLKPTLSTPFPNTPRHWKEPLTGLKIPKDPMENVMWRGDLLRKAEKDLILQKDLMSAS